MMNTDGKSLVHLNTVKRAKWYGNDVGNACVWNFAIRVLINATIHFYNLWQIRTIPAQNAACVCKSQQWHEEGEKRDTQKNPVCTRPLQLLFILRVDLSRSRFFNLIFLHIAIAVDASFMHACIWCTLHTQKGYWFLLHFSICLSWYSLSIDNILHRRRFFLGCSVVHAWVFVCMQMHNLIFYHWSTTSMTKHIENQRHSSQKKDAAVLLNNSNNDRVLPWKNVDFVYYVHTWVHMRCRQFTDAQAQHNLNLGNAEKTPIDQQR